ncbi:hypothetical protein WJX72_000774 [[Myrmecia] bisecta]|uniref:Ferritin n=1 Tax=[Myrmecia] bisecta TaxID=41462 RepID=A0AAW1R497_9CHLO
MASLTASLHVCKYLAGSPVAARRPTAPCSGVQLMVRCAQSKEVAKTGDMAFRPFSEVKNELQTVSTTDNSVKSFARLDYTAQCEAAINEQINIEYNISYVYHALWAYFDRDNVGLPGMAAYFKGGSEEEREHAELLMTFQNVRGGRVKLQTITMPEMEFNHPEKGDALYAMELALSLEKLNFQKLRHLHDVAGEAGDAQMCDFIEGELLTPQAQAIKDVSVYVAQLRRVGKGHGVFHFDRELRESLDGAGKIA